jgi:ubiquinone/menaquinone biosynthesis C-methylase UbiE
MDETWDTIADWYAQRLRAGSALHDFAAEALLSALPRNLAGLNLCDVGCGEGTITRALADRGATVVGIDPAQRMIAHARATGNASPPRIVYAVDDGCSLATITSESMDWVTAGLSLNNVPDLDAAIGSTHRVLVPGGRLA